jgi:gamma-glutamylcyclotransferase (GGCT)/AIG2-like uncharacterized protein YtfP
VRFFFYGTLMDADVRRAVLGRRAPRIVTPAVLEGWRRVLVAGASYPAIVRRAGARVDGVLARGIDAAAARRLDRYEGAEYVAIEAAVRTSSRSTPVTATVFVPRPGHVRIRAGKWDVDVWRRRRKRRFLAKLSAPPRATQAGARRYGRNP